MATHWAMAAWSLVALLLLSLIFEPIGWWPVAFVCLVPWLVLVGGAPQAPRVYFYSYVLWLAFFLLNMRWMYPATGAGYAALSVYLAVYFPFVAIPLRHVVRRRHWPLALALPIVWTGCEAVRSVVVSGFPWFYLSHSFYTLLPFIQISDLVGAYGVTFVVAAVNGAVADVVFATLAARRAGETGCRIRAPRFSVVFAASLVLIDLAYGVVQLNRNTTTPGPKVAVIQGDWINTVYAEDAKAYEPHDKATDEEKRATYFSMMRAAAKGKPDIYLIPETPWRMFLNEARVFYTGSTRSFRMLQRHATDEKAIVVTGSASEDRSRNDLLAKVRRYNSATVFRPDGSEPERYDKVHLVYFGEAVPFRFGRLRWLYFWMNSLMPFSHGGSIEYSIFHGRAFRSFSMETAVGDGSSAAPRTYRFATPICYEDVMPYVSRRFVCGGAKEKQVDFLLNISNDGWFGRGIQQPQHLAICAFRAVENRVGIARAVNTGVSAFIQPSGRIHDRVIGNPDTPWPGQCGFSVASVGVDSRFTLYSRYGDWFAWSCAAMWLLLFVDYWIARARGLGS